jgi:hypothetical protein
MDIRRAMDIASGRFELPEMSFGSVMEGMIASLSMEPEGMTDS